MRTAHRRAAAAARSGGRSIAMPRLCHTPGTRDTAGGTRAQARARWAPDRVYTWRSGAHPSPATESTSRNENPRDPRTPVARRHRRRRTRWNLRRRHPVQGRDPHVDRHHRAPARAVRPGALRRRSRPPAHQADHRRAREHPGPRRHPAARERQHRHGPVARGPARALRRGDLRDRRDSRTPTSTSRASTSTGSFGAADFVSWFDGHPDVPRTWPLEAKEVAIFGVGNVALDVARILAKHPKDLLPPRSRRTSWRSSRPRP